MGIQTGSVGPIEYHQSNSGVDTPTTTDINYTPQQFGAPAAGRIITGTVCQDYRVTQGTAYVQNLVIQEPSITFQVHTEPAGGFPVGRHSGEIFVNTSFTWYVET
jgi:hypothetical protein